MQKTHFIYRINDFEQFQFEQNWHKISEFQNFLNEKKKKKKKYI